MQVISSTVRSRTTAWKHFGAGCRAGGSDLGVALDGVEMLCSLKVRVAEAEMCEGEQ